LVVVNRLQGTQGPSFTQPGSSGVRKNPYLSDGRRAMKKAKPGEIDYPRLFQAMLTCRRILQPYREERMHAVRQLAGAHYSEGGTDFRVPVNLIYKYVQVMSRTLIPNCPRVMLATRHKEGQPAVAAMADWINQELIEKKAEERLERWIVDAMMSIGIMKVALATPADAALHGYTEQAGVPFMEVVDLDDLVFDVGAKTFEQASYIGHRYRVSLAVAKRLTYFDSEGRKGLEGQSAPDDYRINQEGDDRIGVVGTGWQGGEVRDYEQMVDLWEIYIPREKRVLTFGSNHGGVPDQDATPLRVQEWVGPDCGPYHFLSFMKVPGNAMPASPILQIIDLHEFINKGYRKLVNQMQRQKEVLPVSGGQMDDAKELKQANDGDMFVCNDPNAIKAVSYGGPNQVNANFTVHLLDIFNKQAGNLDLLGGTSPQSKTVGQDKMLAAAANGTAQDMQETTTKGVASVFKAYCWYWWYHPQQVMKSTRSVPGLPDVQVQRKLYPGNYQAPPGQGKVMKREGRFEDLQVRIDPYSMVYRSPQDRLNFLFTMFDKFAPLMGLLNSQGIFLDIQFLIKKIAEYADEPDIVNLFTVNDPTPPLDQGTPGGQNPSAPSKPSETTRNYTRTSVGQDTEASRYAKLGNEANRYAADEKRGWLS
jgi:hypothetical protein